MFVISIERRARGRFGPPWNVPGRTSLIISIKRRARGRSGRPRGPRERRIRNRAKCSTRSAPRRSLLRRNRFWEIGFMPNPYCLDFICFRISPLPRFQWRAKCLPECSEYDVLHRGLTRCRTCGVQNTPNMTCCIGRGRMAETFQPRH